jgi:type II secretory pathway pseudopilin PulG
MVDLLTNLSVALLGTVLAVALSAISKSVADRQRKRQEARTAEREQLTIKLYRQALLEQLQVAKADTPFEISVRDLGFHPGEQGVRIA